MAHKKETTASAGTTTSTMKVPQRLLDLQKRVLEGQRSAFEAGYQAMTAFREGQENALRNFLEQSRFVPEEFRQVADEWINTARSGRENFKETVERTFTLVEQYVDGLGEKPETAAQA
jgi:hypothetical protein